MTMGESSDRQTATVTRPARLPAARVLALLLQLQLLLLPPCCRSDDGGVQTAWWWDRHSDPELSYKRVDEFIRRPRKRGIDYERSVPLPPPSPSPPPLPPTTTAGTSAATGACTGPRPCVGSKVRLAEGTSSPMLAGGQLGTVLEDDGGEYAFNVTNVAGQTGWFSEKQLVLVRWVGDPVANQMHGGMGERNAL